MSLSYFLKIFNRTISIRWHSRLVSKKKHLKSSFSRELFFVVALLDSRLQGVCLQTKVRIHFLQAKTHNFENRFTIGWILWTCIDNRCMHTYERIRRKKVSPLWRMNKEKMNWTLNVDWLSRIMSYDMIKFIINNSWLSYSFLFSLFIQRDLYILTHLYTSYSMTIQKIRRWVKRKCKKEGRTCNLTNIYGSRSSKEREYSFVENQCRRLFDVKTLLTGSIRRQVDYKETRVKDVDRREEMRQKHV